MNDLESFLALVATMRAAQRDYFKKPITPKLIAAKAAERDVDRYIDERRGVREFIFDTRETDEPVPY